VTHLAALGGLIDVSPDGKTLLYRAGPRLYSVRLDDPGAFPQMLANAVQARFSADGHWIAYVSTGDYRQLWVRPFPSGGLPMQLTSDGGSDPVWRGDGEEIVYRNGSKIYAMRVHVKGNVLSAEPPQALFDVRVPSGMIGDSMPMDMTRDGSKILFAQGVENADSNTTYVMTDWTTALHR
jgi:Tol biopolymer transport system component